MSYRRRLGAACRTAAICLWLIVVVRAPETTEAAGTSVFERSVLKGNLDQNAEDYYAAIWASLQFFHGTDSARALLAPLDVVAHRREVDSIIGVLFLPLDTDPIAPGNSFLEGLPEKIAYCRNRGFLHAGGAFLTDVFDHIGLLILLNGIPDLAYVIDTQPVLCTRSPDAHAPEYHIAWSGEEYNFQEDCFGYWRLVATEFPRGGWNDPQKEMNLQLTGGVAQFDPDVPLDERSVIAQPVAILDSTNWLSQWTVINLGLRARDFVHDSGGVMQLRMHARLSVSESGMEEPSVLDSTSMSVDLGKEKPGSDDLVVVQRIEKADSASDGRKTRGRVLGVDVTNPKDHHWKKSILFPIGWSDDSVTVAYGWLLNPQVTNARSIGGRPPLVHDVVAPGDSLLLFFQLTGVEPDMQGRFRTHVRLRFIRQEEHKREVLLGRLYRLGTEPLAGTRSKDALSAATILGMIEMRSPNGNVTFHTKVPALKSAVYKIVAECHRTTGVDPRPFEMVIFDNIQIKDRETQAAR